MAKTENTVEQVKQETEEQKVLVMLPLLEEDKPGSVDQTVSVQLAGKNGNRPLVIKRGVRVEVPLWAFEILYNSGRFPGI